MKLLSSFNKMVVFYVLFFPTLLFSQSVDQLVQKADSLVSANNYDDAVYYSLKALEILPLQNKKDSVKKASLYHQIGEYYMITPNLTEAINMFKQAAEWRKILFGEISLKRSESLKNLGNAYGVSSNLPQARKVLNEAYSIQSKLLPENDLQTAETIRLLGIVVYSEKDFVHAESLFNKAFEKIQNSGIQNHIIFPQIYINLGNIQKTKSEFVIALSFYKKAVEHCESHPEYSLSILSSALNNVGIMYNRLDSTEIASQHIQKSLEVDEKYYGGNHYKMIPTMCNLGDHYYETKRISTGDSLYSIALDVAKNQLSPLHPFTARILNQYGYHLIGKANDTLKGLVNLEEAFKLGLEYFHNVGLYLNKQQAYYYARTVKTLGREYLAWLLLCDIDDPEIQKKIIEVILNLKNLISDLILEQRKVFFVHDDSLHLMLFSKLKTIKVEIAELFNKGVRVVGEKRYFHELDSLSNLVTDLESQLSKSNAEFGNYIKRDYISINDIVHALPNKSCLQEYYKFHFVDDQKVQFSNYLAFKIFSDSSFSFSILDSISIIDKVVTEYQTHMYDLSKKKYNPLKEDENQYKKIASNLYALLAIPDLNKIDTAGILFISPDDYLNSISFGALVDGNNKYLIENIPVHYISSGRELFKFTENKETNIGFLAIGDPDFDFIPNTATKSTTNHSLAEPIFRSNCLDFFETKVRGLPGARTEVEKIYAFWKDNNSEQCKLLIGKNATEDNFKQDAVGKRLIHLATHGYYLESNCIDEKSTPINVTPLLKSGILLTGSNHHGTYTDSMNLEDGILSSYEISSLFLQGTEMVVLSSCESALGEVYQGEDVIGLNRAFRVAGVQTIISSLWPVNDELTQKLMIRFYQAKQNIIPHKFRNVSVSFLSEMRNQDLSAHPIKWAGFISVGNWR